MNSGNPDQTKGKQTAQNVGSGYSRATSSGAETPTLDQACQYLSDVRPYIHNWTAFCQLLQAMTGLKNPSTAVQAELTGIWFEVIEANPQTILQRFVGETVAGGSSGAT
jgi:hypothetical protein